MNKRKRVLKLKKKDEESHTMKAEVHGNKILSNKGFVRDVKYNLTTRTDIVLEKYDIPEPYYIED